MFIYIKCVKKIKALLTHEILKKSINGKLADLRHFKWQMFNPCSNKWSKWYQNMTAGNFYHKSCPKMVWFDLVIFSFLGRCIHFIKDILHGCPRTLIYSTSTTWGSMFHQKMLSSLSTNQKLTSMYLKCVISNTCKIMLPFMISYYKYKKDISKICSI